MSTPRVIEPVDIPAPPAPRLLRKGPGGRREAMVDGKWIPEEPKPKKKSMPTSKKNEPTSRQPQTATDRLMANPRIGPSIKRRLIGELEPSPDSPSESSEAMAPNVKQAPREPAQPEMSEMLADIVVRLIDVELHVTEFPSADELPTAIYRHGYRVGWMVAALQLIQTYANVTNPNEATMKRMGTIVSEALTPPQPPEYPG